MNISSNLSALQSNQDFLNTSANAVAQSTTNRDLDIAKEMTNQIVGQNIQETNVSAIKSQDEMFGSLLDIKV